MDARRGEYRSGESEDCAPLKSESLRAHRIDAVSTMPETNHAAPEFIQTQLQPVHEADYARCASFFSNRARERRDTAHKRRTRRRAHGPRAVISSAPSV
jgi:hypothetical protein